MINSDYVPKHCHKKMHMLPLDLGNCTKSHI